MLRGLEGGASGQEVWAQAGGFLETGPMGQSQGCTPERDDPLATA